MGGVWQGDEEIQMANKLDATDPARLRSPWIQAGRILFFVALAGAFLWLTQSMIEHRFFQGGRIDRHGVLRP
jgi:hypothetical protein